MLSIRLLHKLFGFFILYRIIGKNIFQWPPMAASKRSFTYRQSNNHRFIDERYLAAFGLDVLQIAIGWLST